MAAATARGWTSSAHASSFLPPTPDTAPYALSTNTIIMIIMLTLLRNQALCGLRSLRHARNGILRCQHGWGYSVYFLCAGQWETGQLLLWRLQRLWPAGPLSPELLSQITLKVRGQEEGERKSTYRGRGCTHWLALSFFYNLWMNRSMVWISKEELVLPLARQLQDSGQCNLLGDMSPAAPLFPYKWAA